MYVFHIEPQTLRILMIKIEKQIVIARNSVLGQYTTKLNGCKIPEII